MKWCARSMRRHQVILIGRKMSISVQKTKVQAQLPARRTTAVLTGLQLMLLLAAVDQTIISRAMPKIVAQLGFDRYAWATTAYLLTSTVSIPVLGDFRICTEEKSFCLAALHFSSSLPLYVPWQVCSSGQFCLYGQHEPFIALAQCRGWEQE